MFTIENVYRTHIEFEYDYDAHQEVFNKAHEAWENSGSANEPRPVWRHLEDELQGIVDKLQEVFKDGVEVVNIQDGTPASSPYIELEGSRAFQLEGMALMLCSIIEAHPYLNLVEMK